MLKCRHPSNGISLKEEALTTNSCSFLTLIFGRGLVPSFVLEPENDSEIGRENPSRGTRNNKERASVDQKFSVMTNEFTDSSALQQKS